MAADLNQNESEFAFVSGPCRLLKYAVKSSSARFIIQTQDGAWSSHSPTAPAAAVLTAANLTWCPSSTHAYKMPYRDANIC